MILRAKQLCENDSMINLSINLTRGVGTNSSSCLPESGVKYTNEEASEREQLPKDEHGWMRTVTILQILVSTLLVATDTSTLRSEMGYPRKVGRDGKLSQSRDSLSKPSARCKRIGPEEKLLSPKNR